MKLIKNAEHNFEEILCIGLFRDEVLDSISTCILNLV